MILAKKGGSWGKGFYLHQSSGVKGVSPFHAHPHPLPNLHTTVWEDNLYRDNTLSSSVKPVNFLITHRDILDNQKQDCQEEGPGGGVTFFKRGIMDMMGGSV